MFTQPNTHRSNHAPQEQVLYKHRGAALVVSMVLLIILTILVLGSLRGAAMNSKMALNTQLNTAFKTPVEGEVYAQMDMFSGGGNDVDMLISKSIDANGGAFSLMPKAHKRLFKQSPDALNGTDRTCENVASLKGAFIQRDASGNIALENDKPKVVAERTGETSSPSDPSTAIKNIYNCLAVSLYDLTQQAASTAQMPWNSTGFIHGRLCHGYGQTVGCKNMVINVNAEAVKLGETSQSVGFGVVAPQRKGVQGIQNET